MISNLNGIRGILFLLIFGTHFKYIIKDTTIGQILYNPLNNGGFAVLFFFLLSGFCTSIGYSELFNKFIKENYKKFILKRVSKFYPLYFITGIIFLIFFNLPNNFNWLYIFIFSYIPMIFPWTKFLSGGGNPAAWFLAVLFLCYLFTPFLLILMNKIKKIKTFALCCVFSYIVLLIISIILLIFHKEHSEYFYKMPLTHIFQYSIGIISGIVYKKYCINKINLLLNNIFKKNIIDMVVICAVLTVMISPFAHNISGRNIVCLPVILAFIFYLCIDTESILYKLLNNKITLFLSSISFECYLIHLVVIELLKPYYMNYIYTTKGILFIFVILLSITILMSYSYKIICNHIFRYINLSKYINF